MPRNFADKDDWLDGMFVDAPSCDVEITDNPVIGELLGSDGEVIFSLRAHSTVRFGFRGTRDAP